tara:strand:+ start:691 stop:870 length:180 start_codon:yes stop_codon:yes gene_type:complete
LAAIIQGRRSRERELAIDDQFVVLEHQFLDRAGCLDEYRTGSTDLGLHIQKALATLESG